MLLIIVKGTIRVRKLGAFTITLKMKSIKREYVKYGTQDIKKILQKYAEFKMMKNG